MRRTGPQLESLEPRLVLSPQRLFSALAQESIREEEAQPVEQTQSTTEVEPAIEAGKTAVQSKSESTRTAATQPASEIQTAHEAQAAVESTPTGNSQPVSEVQEVQSVAGAQVIAEVQAAVQESKIETDPLPSGTLGNSVADKAVADTTSSSSSTPLTKETSSSSINQNTINQNATSDRQTVHHVDSDKVGESPSTRNDQPIRQETNVTSEVTDGSFQSSTSTADGTSGSGVSADSSLVSTTISHSTESKNEKTASSSADEVRAADKTGSSVAVAPATEDVSPDRRTSTTETTIVTESVSTVAVVSFISVKSVPTESSSDSVDDTSKTDAKETLLTRREVKLAADDVVVAIRADEADDKSDLVEVDDEVQITEQDRKVSDEQDVREEENTSSDDDENGEAPDGAQTSDKASESSGRTEQVQDADSEGNGTALMPYTTKKVVPQETSNDDSQQYPTEPSPASFPAAKETNSISAVVLEEVQEKSDESGSPWVFEITGMILNWLGFGAGPGPDSGRTGGEGVTFAMAGVLPLFLMGRRRTGETNSAESLDGALNLLDRKPWKERRRTTASKAGLSGNRRSRASSPNLSPGGAPDLTSPDISDAFVLSTMQSASPSAFHLESMPLDDSSGKSEEIDSAGLLAGAIAAVAAGGGIASRVHGGKSQRRHQKPTVDYTGTTRAF